MQSQIASSYADAFTGLLDVYHSIGERIPLLLQYEGLFRADVNMSRVLTYLYTDILEFHRRALKYFQQPSTFLSFKIPYYDRTCTHTSN